jgi:hypothetical protein
MSGHDVRPSLSTLLQSTRGRKRRKAPREQAMIERGQEVQSWLRERLEPGPQPAASMWSAAERDGHSRRDIERAKRALGVIVEMQGYQGRWHWSLPVAESRSGAQ